MFFHRRPNNELENQLQPEESGVTTYNNVFDSSNIGKALKILKLRIFRLVVTESS